MSVPIATSPGRSGFGPRLSLSYDSGTGNGPFGLGWSLSLSSVTRKTDKGLPKYRDAEESDVFILSGAEDLVPLLEQNAHGDWVPAELPVRNVNGVDYHIRRYRPRVEGLFARIERWTHTATGAIHWRSVTRDNVTTWYGIDNQARIFDPAEVDGADPTDLDAAHPRRIFSWLIRASYDDKGNAIIYEYAPENDADVDGSQANERNRMRSAGRYLKRIKYGNRTPNRDQNTWEPLDPAGLAADTWMFEVVFDYDEGHYEEVDLDPARPEAEQHRLARAAAAAGRAWAVRPDPFSSYRAGFEMRTYRRCRRILMFHHIPDLPTGEKGYDGLVRSFEFDYADLGYQQPISIERELTHQGSTRFASFLRSVTQTGFVRDETRPVVARHGASYATYLKKSLPPLVFEYSKAALREQVLELDAASLENLPAGLDGAAYQWVDLDGEGVCGVLTEQAGAWFYKRNLSPLPVPGNGTEPPPARFAPVEIVASKPALSLADGRAQFMDLAGDGRPDLVQMEGPVRGFYERTCDGNWLSFQPFPSWPNIDTRDPNLKFVDLTGDGHADILVSEEGVFTWYDSLGEEGFAYAGRVPQALDEETGPRLVFADGTQSIYLADMSGDGLTDLVRIRNGEVCYWPNLGYGRFGAKVTMDHAPRFDCPDQFDQRRIRLADIDGSGTTDMIYLAREGIRLYFNQSGNAWSQPRRLRQFPHGDNLSSVMAVDLLGNGTACLVWSAPLPAAARRPMRYVDLMGGTKPHLLTKTINNLGAETEIRYAPSTRFYLADQREGRPWVIHLPFPVHVVERVITRDRISGNQFVTRYAYHHGYFDGPEREFRGFGLVEQWDTEEFAALTAAGPAPAGTNIEASSHVPPVLTKTWFHTGAWVDAQRISRQFEQEYYAEGDPSLGEGTLTKDQLQAILLPDTELPDALPAEEVPEACRALKGSILRREVYALDRGPDGLLTEKADRPYRVSERCYCLKRLQARGPNRHAVFYSHPQQTLDFHYERELVEIAGVPRADPRISHALTLKVDDYGNVERSVSIGYRRRPVPALPSPEQAATHIVLTVNRFAHHAGEDDWYRTGVPVETRTYELVKPPEPVVAAGLVALFSYRTISDLVERLFPCATAAPSTASSWPYEKWDWRRNAAQAPPDTRLRLIEHRRTLYRPDDMGAARNDPLALLPLGDVESLALPGDSYKLAFTPDLFAQVYGGRADDVGMEDEGGYVHTEGDANWWIPSGRVFYCPDPATAPTQELAWARRHFFLPHRYRDPFGQETTALYDSSPGNASANHDLLVVETRDPLGSVVTVATKDDAGRAEMRNDYRVLQSYWVTDPNGNRTRVAFDALDNQPVYLIFLLVSAPDTVEPHLEALRRITALLKNDDFCAFLRRARTQSELSELLREADERLRP